MVIKITNVGHLMSYLLVKKKISYFKELKQNRIKKIHLDKLFKDILIAIISIHLNRKITIILSDYRYDFLIKIFLINNII